ncbi:hypothetical protein BX616_001614 [Lobosporangium transversale]|uniref:3CxxC-type domain-containing protein n=1 Tax=Lobosporangium transversale TaxID=64571 RepID=A0A1Y2GYL3_9FUNG|nr:hypothetical protein BCR41DRAFT_367740 [Lobosporangium transversale]KAF9917232.1 hypothetical protein BX616_001614 [Lobosporangium transversale]ORZ27389.1 hypothetical protein BCR41DRAFT_367740 [Lobosporangium transversale]|eukprot:XP_021885116.1 hypothetical protein BCR41DRAFT_367740 [Lobosporangium transversale]
MPNRSHARKTIDGAFLHAYIMGQDSYPISYDQHIRATKYRALAIYGSFTCQSLSCASRTWTSGIIATELKFSNVDNSYHTTIHSQRCKDCEQYVEPSVNIDDYTEKILWVLDLWRGHRKAIKQTDNRSSDGPHGDERCHACVVGSCPWKTRRR